MARGRRLWGARRTRRAFPSSGSGGSNRSPTRRAVSLRLCPRPPECEGATARKTGLHFLSSEAPYNSDGAENGQMSDSISVVINGERKDVPAGVNVMRLLAHLGLPPGRVAIERNLD